MGAHWESNTSAPKKDKGPRRKPLHPSPAETAATTKTNTASLHAFDGVPAVQPPPQRSFPHCLASARVSNTAVTDAMES